MAITVPMGTVYFLLSLHLLNATFFSIFILTYCVIYHPYVTGKRLLNMGVIDKRHFWKTFIPSWNWKYYPDLFSAR